MYIPEGTPPLVPNAMARIERRLPQPGEILVRVGERVEPGDAIARAFLSVPSHIVNVAQTLGIPPARVERAMRRERGNKIVQGEVLARTNRLGGRTCQVPVSGIIADVDSATGYVTIAPDPVEFTMYAAVRGIVMEVQPLEGVVIETPAAQVYGVFGLGEERSGVLRLLVTDPTEIITDNQIDARSAYAILIGGAGITAAALRRAVQEQVLGVIVGGIDERELRTFLGWAGVEDWYTGQDSWQVPHPRHGGDPGLTLMLTEGFGIHPMAEPMFDLLSAQDRQEALIEGTTQLRYPLRRPRVVIPLARSSGSQLELPRPPLRPGATVRLSDTAHMGQIARVHSVPSLPRRIDAGVYVPAVEVVQDDTPPFWLPRTAVEVLTGPETA
ncbi:MAG: hypothetical protein ACLFVO_05375 [Chloroflexaceae bacterium]